MGLLVEEGTHLIYYNEVGRPSKLPHFYAAPPSPSLHRPSLVHMFPFGPLNILYWFYAYFNNAVVQIKLVLNQIVFPGISRFQRKQAS